MKRLRNERRGGRVDNQFDTKCACTDNDECFPGNPLVVGFSASLSNLVFVCGEDDVDICFASSGVTKQVEIVGEFLCDFAGRQ